MGKIENYNSSSTQAERTERARKAGIASGEARRRKSKMKDVMAAALAASVAEKDVSDILLAAGLEPTQEAAVVYSMVQKARQGDVRAAQFCRDTLNEAPAQSIELTTLHDQVDIKQSIERMSTENLLALIAQGDAMYGKPERDCIMA